MHGCSEPELTVSSEQRNVACSFATNANDGVLSEVRPPGPSVIVESGGPTSMRKLQLSALVSALPAASTARTSNVCEPSGSAASVSGLVQGRRPPAPIRHWNVEPPSLELNVNVGVVSLPSSGGLLLIVVSGAVTSTVQLRLAATGSALSAASTARTWNECGPSESPPAVCEVAPLQVTNAPPSTLHSKRTADSFELNVNVALVLAVGPLGPPVIVVSGSIVSTRNWRVAGVGSVSPTLSVATTENVWRPSTSGASAFGLLHAPSEVPSMAQTNVLPGRVGREGEDRRAVGRRGRRRRGAPVICVSSGAPSLLKLRVAGSRRCCPRRPRRARRSRARRCRAGRRSSGSRTG